MAVGNTTSRDLLITGNIDMSGIGKALKLSNGVDMTLAAGSTLTTADAINLGTTLNFGATTTLSDYSGATGSAGQILTINAAGTGVDGEVPTASTNYSAGTRQGILLLRRNKLCRQITYL